MSSERGAQPDGSLVAALVAEQKSAAHSGGLLRFADAISSAAQIRPNSEAGVRLLDRREPAGAQAPSRSTVGYRSSSR
jgi:hypothetical protein